MNVQPGATFEAVVDMSTTGLVGTLGIRIIDNQGATTTARTTTSIIEYPSGSGIYQATRTAPSTSGQYTLVWDDGTNYATEDLTVTASTIGALTGQLYVTRDELKAAINLSGQTYADDDIDRACTGASRGIDWATNQFFYSSTGTRYYNAERYATTVETDPIQSITQLSVDLSGAGTYTNWTQDTDYWVSPYNAAEYDRPYERVELRRLSQVSWPTCPRGVKIEGTFGWAAIPAEVRQFAMFFATRLLYRTRHAPFGVVLVSGDVGAVGRLARTDPDFDSLVGGLVRSRPFF